MFSPNQCLKERYQLHQRLGRTAAGRQTWLATDLQSKKKFVVKLLAFSPEMQWEELKLFEREAQVLQALNHPRIPHYRDYFSLDKDSGLTLPWFGLVQDYIPGNSLQTLLDNNKIFTEKQVRRIASEVLNIIVYLHELSPPVLHRDIKPSNLVLMKKKWVYLVDFGTVQAQAAVTGVTFTVVGTSGYTPLEQFWGRAVAASDLYALGATLIHLLTGIAPADLPQTEGQIQFRDFLRDSCDSRLSLNSQFISWIEQMTELSLERRFSTAQEAREALRDRQIPPSNPPPRPVCEKLSKPSGQLIKVKTTRDRLEIILLSPAFVEIIQKIKFVYVELVLFNLLIFLCFIGSLPTLVLMPSFQAIGFTAFNLVLLGVSINLSLNWFRAQTQTTYVLFDRTCDKLEIKRKKWLSKTIQQQTQITDIGNVFLIHGDSSYEIGIISTHCLCRISGNLDNIDSAWLLQTILDWLDLK
ncbi:MAG: serine/threonine-protein kinase [Coleofasciculus chthonoplastes F3-SA18-01]|uniref:serine/threonine protein kinase n=1 Tax=Coleofasciculus chthonoplastes TaxID=64178 RepID=UPI0032F39A10